MKVIMPNMSQLSEFIEKFNPEMEEKGTQPKIYDCVPKNIKSEYIWSVVNGPKNETVAFPGVLHTDCLYYIVCSVSHRSESLSYIL